MVGKICTGEYYIQGINLRVGTFASCNNSCPTSRAKLQNRQTYFLVLVAFGESLSHLHRARGCYWEAKCRLFLSLVPAPAYHVVCCPFPKPVASQVLQRPSNYLDLIGRGHDPKRSLLEAYAAVAFGDGLDLGQLGLVYKGTTVTVATIYLGSLGFGGHCVMDGAYSLRGFSRYYQTLRKSTDNLGVE